MNDTESSPHDGPTLSRQNGTTRVSINHPNELRKLPPGESDWQRLERMTDEEIERGALADPDAQPMQPQELARLRRMPDVKQLRQRLGLTQQQFAERYMLSVATVRDWEQHRRLPLGPAMGYLYAIAAEPERVAAAVAAEEHATNGKQEE